MDQKLCVFGIIFTQQNQPFTLSQCIDVSSKVNLTIRLQENTNPKINVSFLL